MTRKWSGSAVFSHSAGGNLIQQLQGTNQRETSIGVPLWQRFPLSLPQRGLLSLSLSLALFYFMLPGRTIQVSCPTNLMDASRPLACVLSEYMTPRGFFPSVSSTSLALLQPQLSSLFMRALLWLQPHVLPTYPRFMCLYQEARGLVSIKATNRLIGALLGAGHCACVWDIMRNRKDYCLPSGRSQ